MHHTFPDGFIVSILMGLAVRLIVDSASSTATWLLAIEQISMRSLKKEGEGGIGAEIVCSSSLSDVAEVEEGGDALDVDPNESSESGDGRRGVALTVPEGEAMISVGGRICWTLVQAMSLSMSNESQGCWRESRAEGRSLGLTDSSQFMKSIAASEHRLARRGAVGTLRS